MMMRAGESRSHGLARPGLQSIRCASFLKSGRAWFGAHDPPALQVSGPRIFFVRQDGRDEGSHFEIVHLDRHFVSSVGRSIPAHFGILIRIAKLHVFQAFYHFHTVSKAPGHRTAATFNCEGSRSTF